MLKTYHFRGKHGSRISQLTSIFDSASQSKMFERILDIHSIAPLVGYLYGRREEIDNDDDFEGERQSRATDSEEETLIFSYRLIMLLDFEYEPDPQKRIENAFNLSGDTSEGRKLFNQYLRGGIDVLYEKLIEGKSDPDSYVERLCDFLKDLQDRYNHKVNVEKLLELCD